MKIEPPKFFRVEIWEQHNSGDYIAEAIYYDTLEEANTEARRRMDEIIERGAGSEGDMVRVTDEKGEIQTLITAEETTVIVALEH
jgi:hypothetical protein